MDFDFDEARIRVAAADATLLRTPPFPKFHTKWSLDTIYASAVSGAASVLVSRLKSAKMGACLPPSLARKKEGSQLGFPATASVISPSFEGFIAV